MEHRTHKCSSCTLPHLHRERHGVPGSRFDQLPMHDGDTSKHCHDPQQTRAPHVSKILSSISKLCPLRHASGYMGLPLYVLDVTKTTTTIAIQGPSAQQSRSPLIHIWFVLLVQMLFSLSGNIVL